MNFPDFKPEAILLLVPVIITAILFCVLIISRNKSRLGIGLLAVTGLFGLLFSRDRRLREAFDLESKLEKSNRAFGDFKRRQRGRYNAVTANLQVITELQRQLAKMRKNPAENRTEIKLLEVEMRERKELNKKFLNDGENPIPQTSANGSHKNGNIFEVYDLQENGFLSGLPKSLLEDIEIDGHRLLKG